MDGTVVLLAAFPWKPVLWGVGLFLVTFFASLLVVGYLMVRIPPDFFLDSHRRDFLSGRHPALRWSAIILKNALGLLLIALGALTSLPGVPGQGVLTALIGVVLLDIPGKGKLERKIVGHPRVYAAVNRLRARYGKPPLRLEEDSPRGGRTAN